MGEITELLNAAARDQSGALKDVFSRLHQELKVLARSRLRGNRQQTITPTSLVNELYLKMAGSESLSLGSRRHFFACAASAMRQILMDSARSKNAEKRGGDLLFVTLTDSEPGDVGSEVIALNDALDSLQVVDENLKELVELRFFGGLTVSEVAELREQSTRTVERDWAKARAFLYAQMQG